LAANPEGLGPVRIALGTASTTPAASSRRRKPQRHQPAPVGPACNTIPPPSANFWTGSPAFAGFAWYVDFTEGELAPGGVNGDRLLRLVRGGQ
jgi:hypothetical protein